nr:transporter substrate-binding domain-containing protein [Shewanella inventionis]
MLIISNHSYAEPVRIASDIWCPYICENDTGYLVELTKRAFEIQGKKAVFATLPYNRALVELKRQNVDAVLALTPGAIADNHLIHADVIVGYSSNDFYTASNNKTVFENLGNLNNTQQTAVVSGYDYGIELNAWLHAHPNTYYASGDAPLAMNIIRLVKGRHDVIIDNKNVIEYTASQLNLSQQLRYAGTIGEPVPLYVGFNQLNKANAAIFANGILLLKQSGEYQKIIDKYKIIPANNSHSIHYQRVKKFLPSVH